jgi:hypothetical protein
VALIVGFMRPNKWTLEEAAENLSISGAQVSAANLYYQEHQAEIERLEAEEKGAI